jgi:hypothetical protein
MSVKTMSPSAFNKVFIERGYTLDEWLDELRLSVSGIRTLALELKADHATFKTVVDELTAWAEALSTKLNADTGVTDADYDAIITADAPATLSASDPSALPFEFTP